MTSAACGDPPTDPGPVLEIVVAGGDLQYGTPGQLLPAALEALVRRVDTGAHQKNVIVDWTVVSGAGTLSTSTTTTDEDGYARATLRLGGASDTVRVRASLRVQSSASATFEAYAAAAPEISSTSVGSARAGSTITLFGRGFSTTPRQNVVLFSGIRGRVVAATPTELSVEVPPCLPGGTVSVTGQLGTLVSAPVSLQVEDAGGVTAIDPGGYVDVDERQTIECLRLQGGGARYLVIAESAGTIGAARYGWTLTGLSAQGGVIAAPTVSAADAVGPGSFAARWEESLRRREADLVRAGARLPPPATIRAPAPAPQVGDRRSFKVLNAKSTFDDVSAVARVVSEEAVVYVDEKAPSGGYTDAELQAFAASFDRAIYPTDTENFGMPSDQDGNDRIVILFTPTVNALTPRGSNTGFVGGFFYGLDLLDREGSNHAEVFYALVPDPTGVYSDPRSKERILEIMPAILAHEFEHMIQFNERVLKLKAEGNEALWLSEGMAQMAEELVGRFYEDRGEHEEARSFREGDEDRAQRYLAAPSAASLIVATGQGSLEERGAGWLFVLYLHALDKGGDVLWRLTHSTRSGVENVAWATGRPWSEVFSDWAASIYLDDHPSGEYPFEYPGVNLRTRLRLPTGQYPLAPETLGPGTFERTGSLWSSSVKHYIVVPPSTGSLVLRLGGEAGGNAPVDAAFRLRVVRLR